MKAVIVVLANERESDLSVNEMKSVGFGEALAHAPFRLFKSNGDLTQEQEAVCLDFECKS